ncbi:MAG: FAD-dependent monooxygenase, partial [Solirubrobacteraceae bacterium]
VRTHELFYTNRLGQVVWHELRGTEAGHAVPQFSIHRGVLQGVLRDAVLERLGPEAICTSRRLVSFTQDEGGITAEFADGGGGGPVQRVRAPALIGADGIHSTVRDTLVPGEAPPRWNGTMLWRGAVDWPAFLTGRSMIIAGGMDAKLVLYPIGAGSAADRRLTNWAVMARTGAEGDPPARREDWSRPGRLDELAPYIARFEIEHVDVPQLIRSTPVFWEYPVCDRDPLARWTEGRVTLLGDAAHPMYPVGSNGASQAILDAVELADQLASLSPDVPAALDAYERARREQTSEIVLSNRGGGPEGVIDAVEALAPDGFDDVESVLPYAEREAIVRGYARRAGFAVPSLSSRQSQSPTQSPRQSQSLSQGR